MSTDCDVHPYTVLKGLIGHLLGKKFWKDVLLTGGGFSALVYKLVKKNPENVLLTHCPINPFKTVFEFKFREIIIQ